MLCSSWPLKANNEQSRILDTARRQASCLPQMFSLRMPGKPPSRRFSSVPGFSQFILWLEYQLRGERFSCSSDILIINRCSFSGIFILQTYPFHLNSKKILQKWIKYCLSMEESNNCQILPFNGNIMLPAPLEWLTTVAIYLMNQLDT
ncbi:uncharacterized protein CEXT_158051 [Caerostris extrusa]|uniref:Uncharacterized protein n=1 Tax=Caerostris extrusa TaxID=172846 RepID=A0AAV4PQQ0_CAEEX|nr:uncharacterized protein CEXT_158051 [Caerostris extrusa]